MKIKIIIYLTSILLLIPMNIGAIDIYSNNGILYNLNDDEIIYKKNEQEIVQIASLTKIMTAIVTLENVDDLDQTVIITSEIFNGLEGYATAGFKIGDIVTYKDLLYGLMLPSGAECAYALAINISGSVEQFVNLMNEKALEFNLTNTHFQNPIGMDNIDNYSTVEDVAEMLKYALKNPLFYQIFTTKEYITSNNIKLESTIKEKSDKYNLDVSNILGSKTGFTDGAGYCLASIAKINDINYLLITTKANTNQQYQVMDAINIYDYYSKNYSYKQILGYNQLLKTIKIKKSFQKEYNIYSDIDKYLYLNNEIDEERIVYDYVGKEELVNETIGDYIGNVNIKYNDEILYTYDVYIKQKINYINYQLIIISIVLSIILVILIFKLRHKKR